MFLLGQGRQGKTSLARAFLDPSARAPPIDRADRTVALDVFRGWRPGPSGSDVQVRSPARQLWFMMRAGAVTAVAVVRIDSTGIIG